MPIIEGSILVAPPYDIAIPGNLPDAVKGHQARLATIIDHLDREIVVGGEADLPDSDNHHPTLHLVIVADPEVGLAKFCIPADAIQKLVDRHHGGT